MSARASIVAALIGTNLSFFSIALGTALGQDAQAEATAKATKRQATEDATRSTLDVATPTDVGTPPRTGTSTAEAREKLNRRAGEQGDSGRGRTLLLGMHVKEAADGAVEVGDVGVATPAEKAGIRKGDKIIAFQKFKADSYRKWIDGMRRLATEAPDGSMVTVVVSRDGNPVTTKIRVPENQIGPIKLPLGPQPGQQQNQPPTGNDVNAVAANGGDSNVSITNSEAMGSFFNGASEAGTEKAVAELFRIGPSHKLSEQGSNSGSSQPTGGARVGFAGFRNDANGMMLMVDVGGLDPGNYTVSISDASVLGNQTQEIQATNSNAGSASGASSGTGTTQGFPDEAKPSRSVPNPNGTPLESPDAASAPQSNAELPSQLFPRTVLAQVSGNNASEGTAGPSERVQPLTSPASGQAHPTITAPRNHSNAPAADSGRSKVNQNAGVTPPIQNSLGTLTVDQSGTGRMQQVVEGVRVRNVVGQALVIYTAFNSAAVTLPPNLDPTADPSPVKTNSTTGATASSNELSATSENRATAVVGGMIHLLSDRGNNASGGQGTNQSPGGQRNPSR